MSKAKKVLVVGAGCSGLAAAYTLCKYGEDDVEVHLIESQRRVGGHAWTVEVPAESEEQNNETYGETEKADMGFMVCNEITYPNMMSIFDDIGAETDESDMSLAVHDGGRFCWSFQSDWGWYLRNIWRPRLWKFLAAHSAFRKKAIEVLNATETETMNMTLNEFCEGLDQTFCNQFLVAFVSAVWSVGYGDSRDFAVRPLLHFMHNHRFLGLDALKWRTPKMRSEDYVERIIKACGKKLKIRTGCKAKRLDGKHHKLICEQEGSGVSIDYDKIILACSAPEQAALHPYGEEWLSKFKTRTSRVCGHTLPDNMPPVRSDWSSWNVRSDKVADDSVAVSYWLSKIQNLKNRSVFISLNPSRKPTGTFYDANLSHPVMDVASELAQTQSSQIQGKQNTYYCGAWLRHGFHEDGFHTGIHAAKMALGSKPGDPGAKVPLQFPTATAIMPPRAVSGVTNHTRHQPVLRAFQYPLHMYLFDTRTPPEGYHREDHFGDLSKSLDYCVRQAVWEKLSFWPAGRIMCVCNLRSFGYCFNPISPFYIYDERDKLVGLLTEVHNTPWAERCLYASLVKDKTELGNVKVLVPATHRKIMHVSPFHPSPIHTKGEPAWFYKFTLEENKNGHQLVVQAYKSVNAKLDWTPEENDGELRFTATMEMDYTKAHNVRTGSIRSVLQVYKQALMMAPSFTFYGHQPEPVGFTDPLLYSWLLLLPAAAYARQKGEYFLSLTLLALVASMVLFRRSASGLIFLLYIAAVAGVAGYFRLVILIPWILALTPLIFSSTGTMEKTTRLLSRVSLFGALTVIALSLDGKWKWSMSIVYNYS